VETTARAANQADGGWGDCYRVMDERGQLVDGVAQPDLDPGLLRRFYVDMVAGRRYDEEAMALQRQGHLAVYAPLRGQEACQVGSAHALDREDWIFPSYREPAALRVHGLNLPELLRDINGGIWLGGTWDPREFRIAPFAVPLASQLCHAAGFALGTKTDGLSTVALTYFGDGSASEGDFHEALNIASTLRAPVVFFCQNNQCAISTPVERQTNGRIADRAIGYGITGIRVDGNDVIACYLATHEAVARAREQHEPTLIEALTFRMLPHSTIDDPSRYDYASRRAPWESRDPIARLEAYLRGAGEWDDALAREARETGDELAAQTRAAVLSETWIPNRAIYDTVFADPPAEIAAAAAAMEGSA
jgi:pyruvate dehydrogenase E1 component alpha subunit